MALKVVYNQFTYGSADKLRLDASSSWPPPDPDRIPKVPLAAVHSSAFVRDSDLASDQDRRSAFSKRQQQDLKRFTEMPPSMRQRISPVIENDDDRQDKPSKPTTGAATMTNGTKGWRDSEGDRLDDFGVDEDADYCDDDDDDDEIPLAQLLRRRNINREDSQKCIHRIPSSHEENQRAPFNTHHSPTPS